ncbi:galactose/glucose ABC transporter substrate-binding protein MglB, partial [Pasteurella multocida]
AQAADRIGVTIYKYDDNFMSLMRKEINKEAEQFKDIELLMNDSQNAQAVQNDQVDGLISKGVKALAINLVDPAAAPTIIGKAKPDDIPVVFFNKDPGAKAIGSYEHAYYVGTDPKESGLIQGSLIAKHWQANPAYDLNKDGKIQYVLLKGEPGHPDAEARTKFVIEELNNKGIQTEQLFIDTGMWDAALAKDKMDAWLSSSKANQIEVIIANNDGMAMGALEATKAHGKKLPIFGVDALPEVLQLIKKGEIAGTVLNDGVNQGKAVVQLSNNLAKGKPATEGTKWQLKDRVVRIPYVGVDADNLNEFLK